MLIIKVLRYLQVNINEYLLVITKITKLLLSLLPSPHNQMLQMLILV